MAVNAVNVLQYELKIKRLLEKFLEPNFQIKNDVYLNVLLSHLSGKENKELGDALINLRIVRDWVAEAITHWESSSIQPSQTIGTFILHLLSLLSKEEQKFVCFREHNTYNRLFVILNIKAPECNPSLKLGYIKVLSSFLQHYTGIEYVVSSEYWLDALVFCLSNQTVYIVKEGYSFMYKLLEATINHQIFCDTLVKHILAPLLDNNIHSGPFPEIKEEIFKRHVTPTLQLIDYILESYFKSNHYADKNFQIPALFLKYNNLEQVIWQIILMVHNSELTLELEKIMIMIYFLDMNMNCAEDIYPRELLLSTSKPIFQIIHTHLSKREIPNVLKLCYWVHYFWQYIRPRCPPQDPKQKHHLLLENQLLVLQVTPLFGVSHKHCRITYSDLIDEFRDNFITKLFKIMCESTIRMAYNWRTVIFDQEDVFANSQVAINYLLKSRIYFKRDTAVTCFQAIIYGLKDVSHIVRTNPELIGETFNKHTTYLSSLVDAVAAFIQDYDFTWRDSVETICVMSCCMDLLTYPNWETRLLVRTLKLLNLSIARFMAPNLALLVEKTSDTTMDSLGPMLITKLHGIHWEVRDSALEVVHTISEISQTKFPAFQKTLLDSGFLPLVITMSKTDSESFVRASAIKCLQKMINVSAFWHSHLEQEELPQKMIQILSNETEAMVRCEAATLLCDIYLHQSFCEKIMPEVYEIMAYAVTSDLHWEVKINALSFWEHVINNHLQHQGMIDGSFPNVTFSKEHKKIVTLTDPEIKTRLNKALVQLSNCGCLGVLISAVLDDCDLEVSKSAISKIKVLSDLLKKYNIETSTNVYNTSPSPSITNSTIAPNLISHANFSNDVLDEIVNAKDITLLSSIYNPNEDSINKHFEKKHLKIVAPETFVVFLQNDLKSLVDERKNWLNNIDNLSSLLDDMLKTYENDINSMDCY